MKKLIVLATLAALPAVAMADVTISGNIGVAYQGIKTGDSAYKRDLIKQEGDILFSGSEDLGNGLKAFWKYDHFFNADKVASSADGNGETLIGLSGSFGKVQLGATDNAAREIGSVGLADLPTVFGVHTTSDQNSAYKASRKRLKDGITYVAPTTNGLTFAISQSLKGADNESGGATSVGIKYAVNDALTLAYGGNSVRQYANGAKDRNYAHELGASLSLGDFGLNAGYAWEKTTFAKAVAADKVEPYNPARAAGDVVKRKGVALSGSYAMGATTLIAGLYSQANEKVNGVKADGTGYNNYTLGVNQDLSKRTHVGLEFSKAKYKNNNRDANQTGIATYIWHSF